MALTKAHNRMIKGGLITPLDFNAAGDGSTDDTAAIQAALNSSYAVIDGAGKTYRCDTQITIGSNKVLQNITLDFSNGADDLEAFIAAGSFNSPVSLSANAAFNTTTISVSSADGLAAGDLIYIADTQIWADSTPQGEMQVIKSISGTTLTLTAKLVGSYATASAANIRKVNTAENIRLENVKLTGKGAEQTGLYFDKARNTTLRSCVFDNFGTRLTRFTKSYAVSISNCAFSNADRSGYGYGVAISEGTHHVQVTNCTFDLMRHAVSQGGSDGVNRFVSVTNCTGTGIKDSFLDTHAESDFVNYSGNVATFIEDNASDDAITLQGANAIVADNMFYGTVRHGVLAQVQVNDGMTQDSPSISITGNQMLNGGTGSGVTLSTSSSGCVDLKNVVISNNAINGFAARAVSISADNGNIEGLIITGNTASMASNGVLLTSTSPNTISGVVISNNYLAMDTDAAESIYLQPDASAGISNVVINGNMIKNGTNGIRLNTSDVVMVTSNQSSGLSGATVNSGSATNVTAANNV